MVTLMFNDDVYPRETPPHFRTAQASPQRHTAAGTAAPTTADTGNTVPQRANPTQTAYAHPRRRAQAQGQRLGTWTLVRKEKQQPARVGPYKIFFYFEAVVCCARINHPLFALPHLHCPHDCNTIARLLRNRIPPPTHIVYAIRHTVLVSNCNIL